VRTGREPTPLDSLSSIPKTDSPGTVPSRSRYCRPSHRSDHDHCFTRGE
jgi:hypothetical protein